MIIFAPTLEHLTLIIALERGIEVTTNFVVAVLSSERTPITPARGPDLYRFMSRARVGSRWN